MNLEEIRSFLAVVETGSLVAASRRLNVTQSTMTARINGLEEELGQKLLHRNKSGAELTSPGFKFLRYAELMVQLWGQARLEVALPEGFQAICNVGAEFDLWRHTGELFLGHVKKHSPNVALAIWPGEQSQLDRWLRTGLIDIAFCYAPQTSEKFASDDQLVLVSTTPGKAHENYIYIDHGDEFRRSHAATYPVEPTSPLTIASSEWAIDYMLRHGGSGYLPRRHAEPHLKAGSLHVMAGAPVFTRRIYVVENVQAVRNWAWYPAAVAAARG